MNTYDMNPYVLPTIDFVGGETQDLAFNTFFYAGKRPFSLAGCTANFAIVSYINKSGAPIVSKNMGTAYNDDGTVENVLTVTLLPSETVDLSGKYIYQISIKDMSGEIEIPKQGILMITKNINRNFVR